MHRKYPRILGHEAAGLVMLILFSTHGPPLRPLMACVHVISRQLAECFTGVLSPAMDFRVNTSLEYLKWVNSAPSLLNAVTFTLGLV